ncbi:MAG: hypothetical protein FWF59_00530 [Turicibacter sp.]|nr:hypothetical protein [Turicibacter sp.]
MKKIGVMVGLSLLSGVLTGCSNSTAYGNLEISEVLNNTKNRVESNTSFAEIEPDLEVGNFTIMEGQHGFPGDQSNTLTIEEVAEIGAQYVLNVFGYTLQGKYLELTFNYNPHISQSTWVGNVGSSPGDFIGDEEGFFPASIVFSLDAYTGKPLSIQNFDLALFDNLDRDEFFEMSEEEMLELFSLPESEEIENLKAIAERYAKNHFNSESVSIELGSYPAGERGFVLSPSPTLLLMATENITGDVVNLSITRNPIELSSIRVPLERTMNN